MTNTPSSRPPRPQHDLEEATAIDFGQSRAQADPDETDGQETIIWEGTAQLAELEAELAHSDGTTMIVSEELLEEDPPAAANQPPLSDPRVWFLGRSFGGFRVVCELASGGMATVFLARKEGPARVSKHAAIKVIHPHLIAERDFIHMFLDEARIAACLHHPNVCRVLDFGHAEGTYYLAMEYLLGETWSAVRVALALHPEGETLLPLLAAHVLAQACEGLHAAHEATDDEGRPLCVVHRDVSPQNIFVAYDGTVRVLDFGVASAADRITSTRDGILKGRLAYMSPEQMAGEPVGRAADLWAMGVVLRETLEGKRLFRRATDAETMFAISSEPLPPWTVRVPEQLRTIVERALSREPGARHATAHEMALELNRFASTQRGAVSTSALSTWMHELFALQIEQKRALLQLPVPTPRASPLPPSMPAFSPAERGTTGITALVPGAETAAARAPEALRRSLRWLQAHMLLVLGCLGAFTGVVLGRALRGSDASEAHARAASAHAPSAPEAHAPAIEPEVTPAQNTSALPTAPAPVLPEATRAQPEARPAPLPERDAETSSATPHEQADEEQKPALRQAGTLLVAFEGGWAEVYLGSKLLGTTPGRFELPAGRHTLIIKPFGSEPAVKRRVDVEPGAVTKLFLSHTQP